MFSKFDLYTQTNDNALNRKNFLNNLDEESLYELFQMIPIENIVLLDNQHLYKLIKYNDIKSKTLNLASKYFEGETAFNYLLSNMSEETFLEYLDQDLLEQIINSNKKISIVRAILFSNNSNITRVLNKSVFMKFFVDNFLSFNCLMGILPDEVIISMFEYIKDKNPDKLDLIVNLDRKNQLTVIKYLGIYEFYSIVTDRNLFLYLDSQIITLLIEKNPFYTYFLELPINVIISLIKQGLILPANFSHNEKFIKKIMSISNPNIYRFIIDRIMDTSYRNYQRHNWKRFNNCLEYFKENNRTFELNDLGRIKISSEILPPRFFVDLFTDEYLEKERELYYDSQVNLINTFQGLLPEFYDFYKQPKEEKLNFLDKACVNEKLLREWLWKKNRTKEELYEILYNLTTKKFLEILVDRFYKDITYNFLENLNSMLSFFKTTSVSQLNLTEEEQLLLEERLTKYEKINNFYDLSRAEQIMLYNSFDKTKSYTAEFYDDFNLAKNFTYKRYNEVVFDLSRNENLLNDELSSELGVPIYELKGEDYYIYSHVTSIKRSDVINIEPWESTMAQYLDNPFIDEYKKSGLSISLSSSKKKESFRPISEYVSFGFCKLLPRRIAHVYHTDSYSAYYNRGIGMNKINEIYLPEVLIQKTCGYNEILYQEISEILLDRDIREKYEELVPDYLLCYDKIEPHDLILAKRMNIPILVIYTQYYSIEEKTYTTRDHNNEYLTTMSDILDVKTYCKKNNLQY